MTSRRHLPTLVRRMIVASRQAHPDTMRGIEERWNALPDGAKTPGQLLGTRFAGCEGTHGVFPRCNLACTPCYHSREANHVRIDADHTLRQVDAQMRYLRAARGPGQHAQLIGGEVTLLGSATHARALEIMIEHGRKPMSMSHGDFDYDYLVDLCMDPSGGRRFDHVSFAVHVDSTMLGRRGAPRPGSEAELHPVRQGICDMFARLRREHGVRSFLAHNMTVTPDNVDQVADVVRACRSMGFRMLSFQPAAAVGDRRRWATDRSVVTDDGVWRSIEAGIGRALPFDALHVGDPRCNRSAWGLISGDRYIPILDMDQPSSRRARDMFVRSFRGMDFGAPRRLVALRLARIVLARPAIVPAAIHWAVDLIRRIGPVRLARHGAHPLTFVMHNFMDADIVRPAWELMRRGEVSDDPEVRAAQERLSACSYLMAHPDTDQLVPACAQHAVFDPDENRRLKRLLPLVDRTGPAPRSS